MFYTAGWEKKNNNFIFFFLQFMHFTAFFARVETKANENKVKTESYRISEWSEVFKFNYGKVFVCFQFKEKEQTKRKIFFV